MTDCRRVKQLLPLWVGQDLPDSASAADVASHLERCPACERHQKSLQASLETLHSSKSWPSEPSGPSVWPKLASRISEWDDKNRHERFNGWIPASVMALAVALMVAVSIPSIHEALFDDQASSAEVVDLFASVRDLKFVSERDEANPAQARPSHSVIWKPRTTQHRADQF
ncbi:MAG: hypothetical protein WCH39_07180 [Schlesneria sp.]